MSGPYRVVKGWAASEAAWEVRGEEKTIIAQYAHLYPAKTLARQLNAAYAAGIAASGREAEIRGMERAKEIAREWAEREEKTVDAAERKGWRDTVIESQGSMGMAYALAGAIQSEIDKARALTPTEDREYQIAVEKLMEEGSG